MRAAVAALVLALSLMLALPASAAEPLTHKGVDGVWMPTAEAQALVSLAERAKTLEGIVVAQDKLILTLQARVDNVEQRYKLMSDLLDATELHAATGWELYKAEVVAGAAWYRAPVFWTLVGAAAAGAVAAGAAYGASQ